ncbi:hypothetical protein GINT2_000155 [Glugoides intestinalis]
METMVSSSNNTQKVIFLWQKLIWSKQPEGLLSTKSLIVISIVIFLIMTLRNGRMYYNNLLSGFLTILLTIISGIIFGKGFEILFRTLHIICSGAYGNVGFSLADIFISLLFGSIFVIFGPLLLFNKKLYKLLRLLPVDADKGAEPVNEATAVDGHGESEKAGKGAVTVIELEAATVNEAKTVDGLEESEKAGKGAVTVIELEAATVNEAKTVDGLQESEKAGKGAVTVIELEAIMANKELPIVDRLKEMMDYLKLKLEGKLEEIWVKIKVTESEVEAISIETDKKIGWFIKLVPELIPGVKAELEEKDKSIQDLVPNLCKKLLSSELNEVKLDKIEAEFEKIQTELEKYKEMLIKFKAAKEAEFEELEDAYKKHQEMLTKEKAEKEAKEKAEKEAEVEKYKEMLTKEKAEKEKIEAELKAEKEAELKEKTEAELNQVLTGVEAAQKRADEAAEEV